MVEQLHHRRVELPVVAHRTEGVAEGAVADFHQTTQKAEYLVVVQPGEEQLQKKSLRMDRHRPVGQLEQQVLEPSKNLVEAYPWAVQEELR